MKTVNNLFLVLDVNNLAHRNWHALPAFPVNDVATSVLYGVLRDVINLQEQFQTDKVIFCFDQGESLRINDLPMYKFLRRNPKKTGSVVMGKDIRDLDRQLELLKHEVLDDIGFKNVFLQEGYEADDIIASVVNHLPEKSEATIVSSDKDLYQLLSSRVNVYSPIKRSLYTFSNLWLDYELTPTQWIDLKAMSGCKSDCIPGITGVGDKIATKFIRGKLSTTCQVYNNIIRTKHIWQRNLKLVKLPYPGVNTFSFREDEVTEDKWDEVLVKHGLNTLRRMKALR